jgi:hypothetical protein
LRTSSASSRSWPRGGGEPLGGAHGVLPAAGPAIGRLEAALDNLALAATNDTAMLQQLTSANLALTATIGMLTATNKKLVDAATARTKGAPIAGAPIAVPPAERVRFPAHPGNYCWTHGHCIRKDHTRATCTTKATGHREDATAANTLGRSEKDKGWYTALCT